MTDRRYRTVHQNTSDAVDVDALRWQLVERLDAHPMEDWSAALSCALLSTSSTLAVSSSRHRSGVG